MSTIKTNAFRFDRRQLLKYTGYMGVGSTFLAKGLTAFGQDAQICPIVDDTLEVGDIGLQEASNLQYFVDGLHFNDRSNLASRANLALYINENQTPDRFVERVVLTNSQGKTLGVKYFDSDDMTSQGQVPYVIFENIELVFNEVYNIYYQVKDGSNAILFAGQLSNARRSLLNSPSIPQTVLDDFAAYRGENNGLITTPFELYTGSAGLHSARGFVRDIGSDNTFNIDVELMHGDVNVGHFMRYFIIADPIGRIIGMRKRNFGDPIDSAGPAGAPAMRVTAMSDAEAIALGISPADVAKINDCPYIQIYTEDVFDALARSTLRIR